MLNCQRGIHAKFSYGFAEVSSNEVKTFLFHQNWYQSGEVINSFFTPKPLHSVDLGRPAQLAAYSLTQLKVTDWQFPTNYLEVVKV